MAISKKDQDKIKTDIQDTTNHLTENRSKEFIRKTITIDQNTFDRIERFRLTSGLDFSSAIRFMVNSYLDRH